MLKIELGNTGLHASVLALGTGTHGWNHESDQTRRGTDWLIKHFRNGYDLGVNFWDLADMYGSHQCAGEAAKFVGRENVIISTKTTAKDHQTCSEAVERFLKELDTDYIDIVLLHGKSSSDWNTEYSGAMDALSDAMEKKIVRAVGISSHGIDGVRTAASEPWVNVILARLNYAGVQMDTPKEEIIPVLQEAHANGKNVFAMKPLGCGDLVSDPEKAIKYILGLDFISAMSIGHTEDAQLTQNVAIIGKLNGQKSKS